LESPASAGLSWFCGVVPSSPAGTWEQVADNMGTRAGTLGRASVAVHLSRLARPVVHEAWLPHITAGTWADYEAHGRKRLLPHLGASRLAAMTTFEVRDGPLQLPETGEHAPKTLNNALAFLVAAMNGEVADRLLPSSPAIGLERLPLGHLERDWPRPHETGR